MSSSLVDGNKILDSIPIAGDWKILEWMRDLQTRENTLDRAMRVIVFSKYYLDHYYSNRSSDDVPNVKYQTGGHRDFLFYSWFDNAMGLFRGRTWKQETDCKRPKLELALKNMKTNRVISSDEYDAAKTAAEFVILLRNEMLHANRDTKDAGLTYLDRAAQERVFNSAPAYFKSQGAGSPFEIRRIYEKHRGINASIKNRIWKILIFEEGQRKGDGWQREFVAAEEGRIKILNSDPLVNIAAIWGLHRRGDKNSFDAIAETTPLSWDMDASIACSNLASAETLETIRARCQPLPELAYIMRIICRNPNASWETLNQIAADKSSSFYSLLAKKRIAYGLDAAIKRP